MGWIMSLMTKPAQQLVLQAQYRTEQSQCQHDTAAGAPSPTCCQIERPSLGGGLEGRKPVEHRAHHWDLSQQPLQSTIQHWWEEPQGGELPQGTTGLSLWPHLFQQSFFICFLKLKLCFLYPFSNNFSHIFQQLIKPRNKDMYYLDLKLSI